MPTKIVVEDRLFSKEDLVGLCKEFIADVSVHSLLLAHASDRLAFNAAFRLAESIGCGILAAPSYWNEQQVETEGRRWGASGFIHSGTQSCTLTFRPLTTSLSPSFEPGVIIFSSGTTGAPKAISHSWESISASANFVAERLAGRTWYLAYEPAGFAGFQVYFSAVRNEGTLVIPDTNSRFADHARSIVKHRVEVISATPTWWRMLISGWPQELPMPALHQATLGGEIVDQPTLNLVQRLFKPSYLTHIYASSEVGTAIVVSDGKAGFPLEFIGSSRRTELRIVDDVLEVKSPFRMRRYLDAEAAAPEWIRTGDLVEVKDGRCYFGGREDQRLNIGGAKVAPEEVELELLKHPEVLDCVAYGKSSPIVGTLLAADIVAAHPETFNLATFRNQLRGHLPPHKLPQHIRIVNHIGVSPNGKKQRG